MNATITLDFIQKEVARYFSLPPEKIVEDSQKHEIVKPRQICMWLAKEMKVESDKNIGKYFGNRDRTLVISAWNKVNGFIEVDGKYANEIELIYDRFKNMPNYEVWKDIPGYEGFYQASTFGNIRSLDNKIKMKDGRIYEFKGRVIKYQHCIDLHKDGKHTKRSFIRILALTFIPNSNKCLYAIKKDKSKGLNIENIEWSNKKY